MKVVLAGGSGFVGSHLIPALKENGHTVIKLVRKPVKEKDEFFWDPENMILDPKVFEGVDAVINLSGENISESRWTDAFKKKLEDSRLNSTNLIVETVKKVAKPPKTLINASAIGFYSQKLPTPADENTAPGKDFLAILSDKWEQAAKKAEELHVRVVLIRIGVVLGKDGGALKKMLTPFKLGLGGVIGSGKQYISWIDIDDLVDVFLFALNQPSLSGPVNAVAPNPVNNKEFTKTLGKVLSRPTIIPMPAFVAKIAFGEMAEEILINGRKVIPKKLIDKGFPFRYPYLENSLKHLLRKKYK